jgi:hypothetical protein
VGAAWARERRSFAAAVLKEGEWKCACFGGWRLRTNEAPKNEGTTGPTGLAWPKLTNESRNEGSGALRAAGEKMSEGRSVGVLRALAGGARRGE